MGFLRISLAVLVFLWHRHVVGSWLHGPTAVVIFFVISGFYIQLVLDTKYSARRMGEEWVTTFYLARYLKLYPSYIIGVLIVVVAGDVPSVAWTSIQGLLSLIPNLFIVGANIPSTAFLVDGPSWSLGVEIAFYLVAPIILTRSDRVLWLTMAGGMAARLIPYNVHLPLFPSIDVFMLGALAYRHRARLTLPEFGSTAMRHALTYGAVAAVLLVALPSHPLIVIAGNHNDSDMLFYPILAALTVPTLFAWSARFSFDRRIGELSYHFYIFHMPITAIVVRLVEPRFATPVALVTVLLAAVAAYAGEMRLIEPARRRLADGKPALPGRGLVPAN